jgi:hypothetical protein
VSFWRPGWWVWERSHWKNGLEYERGHWRRKPTPPWQSAFSFALYVLLGIIVLLYRWGAAHGASLPPFVPTGTTTTGP